MDVVHIHQCCVCIFVVVNVRRVRAARKGAPCYCAGASVDVECRMWALHYILQVCYGCIDTIFSNVLWWANVLIRDQLEPANHQPALFSHSHVSRKLYFSFSKLKCLILFFFSSRLLVLIWDRYGSGYHWERNRRNRI